MRPQITGTILPVLEIGLDPDDVLVAAPGELAWMTPNVRMNTTTATAGASGLWGALTRAVSGGGLFMTEFAAEGGPGGVAFAPKLPGQIVPVEAQPNRGYLIHRHGFLCATQGVQLSTALQRSLGAGVFGGEGFILQHLSGACQAWVALGGEIVANDLQAGETLLVASWSCRHVRGQRPFRYYDNQRNQERAVRRRRYLPGATHGTRQGLVADP